MDNSVIIGRSEVQGAWRDLLLGLDERHHALTLVDASFADYPLSDAAVLESLSRWLRLPGRHLRLLGLDFEATTKAHPRLARWRRDWVHRISALTPAEPPAERWPSLMVRDDAGIEWLDAPHWRARRITDLVPVLSWIDACAQRCEASWPLHSLGL